MDATTAPRKYKLRTGLTSDRLYTSMAIVPPLLSRSGLLEVRAVSKFYELSLFAPQLSALGLANVRECFNIRNYRCCLALKIAV